MTKDSAVEVESSLINKRKRSDNDDSPAPNAKPKLDSASLLSVPAATAGSSLGNSAIVANKLDDGLKKRKIADEYDALPTSMPSVTNEGHVKKIKVAHSEEVLTASLEPVMTAAIPRILSPPLNISQNSKDDTITDSSKYNNSNKNMSILASTSDSNTPFASNVVNTGDKNVTPVMPSTLATSSEADVSRTTSIIEQAKLMVGLPQQPPVAQFPVLSSTASVPPAARTVPSFSSVGPYMTNPVTSLTSSSMPPIPAPVYLSAPASINFGLYGTATPPPAGESNNTRSIKASTPPPARGVISHTAITPPPASQAGKHYSVRDVVDLTVTSNGIVTSRCVFA